MSFSLNRNLLLASTFVFTIPYLLANSWYTRVQTIVPEPYLDEVFHIPQAQAYCQNHFDQWDPKITTPPGLYLVSLLIGSITSCCSASCLRRHNVALLSTISLACFGVMLQQRFPKFWSVRNISPSSLWNQAHSAINMALFPCLFFFSGLYYTDIASTLTVLLFFRIFVQKSGQHIDSFQSVPWALLTLFMRQTNVFWTAVFPAGLSLVSKAGLATFERPKNKGVAKWTDVLEASWNKSQLFDPTVDEAAFEDYILMALSLAIVSLRNPTRTMRALLPYLVVLASFGAFVLWNKGVVLGDKSNHIATIHTPQMLYIWPYITFFSFPLMVPSAIRLTSGLLSRLRLTNPQSPITKNNLPRLWVIAAFTILAAGLVRFNTIVHPFTLADNRHYMFYAFRILLRHAVTKYGAAPVYIICAWLSITALKEPPRTRSNADASAKSTKSISESNNAPRESTSCRTSFVLVWLVTTALSVITAPLVEPRYFIIPWVMWRLHIPVYHADAAEPEQSAAINSKNRPGKETWLDLIKHHDHRLWLETVWFLAVNCITGYMFLYRGFSWPQEPGKVQRFMW